MKYQLNQPTYPETSGCGGPADCATKQMLHSSKVQNQINNMNGGSSETGPVVPNVVGASDQQNSLFAKVAKLSVDQQENSKYDHETGKGPIKGGKRRTKKRSKKKTKTRRKGGRKSRAKSLSQPRSHAQFMGNNLDYAGHFPAKQGGKTSRRTRKAKKGGDKRTLEEKLIDQEKRRKFELPLSPHSKAKAEWEAQQDAKNIENMNPNNYVAPSDTPGKLAPRQNTNDTDYGTAFAERQNLFGAAMEEAARNMDGDVVAKDFKNPDDDTPFFGGKKRRTRKRHGKGPGCSKCKDAGLPQATVEGEPVTNVHMVPGPNDPLHAEHKKWANKFPTAVSSYPSYQVAQQPRGGKKKTKKFKKHYMWNTKGKRYMAKTYKQHMRGVKLGHTHKKPKKSSRKTKKRGRV
jgi:hypothetical protein